MATNGRDVLVIGGGVIGLSCAYELSKRGARVTVIDKGEMGRGCSYGNAGWITPCFALPLPMPGMFLKALGWLTDPESPLYIKPEPSWLLVRWMTRFLLSMNRRTMLESVRALTEISKYSLDAYARLGAETGADISFERNGLLMVAQTAGGLKYARTEMELVAAHGIPGRELTEEQVFATEPALHGRLAGGVLFPDEAHVEPFAVVGALVRGIEARGGRCLSRAEVIDFDVDRASGGVRSVRTTAGVFRADRYVLATGSWSHAIARGLRLRVPVLGGKGYAIITRPLSPNPSRPLMLLEKKIAVTPRAGTLRLAGTMEIVNRDESITARRVDAIIRGAREFLRVPEKFEYSEIWRGLRPCTPDGVPIIGAPRGLGNLVVATGHQMLGLQSAPATGRLVADLVDGSSPTFDPTPFRADRF